MKHYIGHNIPAIFWNLEGNWFAKVEDLPQFPLVPDNGVKTVVFGLHFHQLEEMEVRRR